METPAKKRGRKAMAPEHLRRPHSISLTDDDHGRIALGAAACRLSLSAYVVKRALGDNPFPYSPNCKVQLVNWEEFARYYPQQAATTHSLEVLRRHVAYHGPMDGWYPNAGTGSEAIFCFSFQAIDLYGTFLFEFNGSAS